MQGRTNVLKFCFSYCFSVQYALHLKGHLQQWRKNPHWSSSCCLALLLHLNDLQEEVSGMAATNVLKTQLESGEFEMVTLEAAVNESVAVDVTLKEVKQAEDDKMDMKDDDRQVTKKSNIKCDQGTQTELLMFLTVADVMLHKPNKERSKNSLLVYTACNSFLCTDDVISTSLL